MLVFLSPYVKLAVWAVFNDGKFKEIVITIITCHLVNSISCNQHVTGVGRLLIFLLRHSSSIVRLRGQRQSREEREPTPFTINVHNFTFSLAARGVEEKRKTARGVKLWTNMNLASMDRLPLPPLFRRSSNPMGEARFFLCPTPVTCRLSHLSQLVSCFTCLIHDWLMPQCYPPRPPPSTTPTS